MTARPPRGPQTGRLTVRKLIICAAAALMAATAVSAQAETPRDALVMAWTIDDIISLDPAEIFEFSAAEFAGHPYDRLIAYDVGDVSNISVEAVASWTISDDGQISNLTMRTGITLPSRHPITPQK